MEIPEMYKELTKIALKWAVYIGFGLLCWIELSKLLDAFL